MPDSSRPTHNEDRLNELAAVQRRPPLAQYFLRRQTVAWLFLLLVALTVMWGVNRLAWNTRMTARTQAELTAVQSVYSAIVDQQAGLRGYVLTEEERYLGPYRKGRQEFPEHLEQLRQLVRGDPDGGRAERLERLDEIERLHRQWLTNVASPVLAAGRQGDFQQAIGVIRQGAGKRLVDTIRSLLDTHRLGQRERQAQLNQASIVTLHQLRWLVIAGLLLALLVSIAATARAARTVSRGFLALTDAARRIAGGRLDERVPLDHVREGALFAVAFNDMTGQLQQRERDLQRSSAFNRLILDSVGEGVIGADTLGRATFANPAALDMTGFSDEELIGRSVHAALHHSRADGTPYPVGECPVQQCLSDGRARSVTEEVFWRRNGTSFPVEYLTMPLRGDDGRIEGTVITFRNVTERQKAERTLRESEARLRAVTANIPVILFAFSPAGEYTLAEGRGLATLGVDGASLVGQSIYERYANKPVIIEYFERAVRGEEVQFTVQLGGRHFEAWFTPMFSEAGSVTGVVGVAADVTERLNAQEELREANEELRRSNAELEQFAYVASHDLQAPLRSVTSFTELLARRLEGQLDDRSTLFIRHVLDGASRMKVLVDDLLTFSRLNRVERTFTPVSVEEVLEGVLQALHDLLQATGAVVTHDPLPTVTGDATELSSLLQNLVENAVKYRSPDRPPRIHVTARYDGSAWQFSVSDNGRGIEPQYFERIFKMFQRLHRSEEIEGTGIGLAVCKKIVEGHGGRIWVESQPGEWSVFHFTLPADLAAGSLTGS